MSKKTKILNAAIHVIALKGYDCASVKEIAKKAGVAQGTPYLYFKNKEKLFLEIILELQKNIDNIIESALALKADFWEKMDYILVNLATYFSKNHDLMNIMRREMPSPIGIGKKGQQAIDSFVESRTKKMNKIYKLLKKETKLNNAFSNQELTKATMLFTFGMIKTIEHEETTEPLKIAKFTLKCMRETFQR